MTNELLATLIGTGEADELQSLLWDKVRGFFILLSNKYVSQHAERCKQCGITVDDIRQESYFAMLDAVKAYCNRPAEQSDFKFITYCKYPFKNRAKALLGYKTKKQYHEPLNNAVSLSTPISNGSMGSPDETELGDVLPDMHSEEELHACEDKEFRLQLRETVQEELADAPDALRVIEQRYYQGRTLEAVGDDMSLSKGRISQIQEAALRRLKKNWKIQMLAGKIDPYRHIGVDTFRREGSIVEQIVERQDASRYRYKINRYAAYFDTLGDASLKKDLEMMRALSESSRNGMREMIEALNDVTRRRGLGVVPLADETGG